MWIPKIHGFIDRRILVNFTVDPDVIAKIIPDPFRPKLVKGKAIAGICLIRLKNVKPKGLPDFLGISSENGAHRIAVEWDEDGVVKEGVYIPRRDTSLRFNALVGGRIFPGRHFLAGFTVRETPTDYHVEFTSSDKTRICVDASITKDLPADSVFETLDEVSQFFERGSVGFSPNGNKFDGLKLRAYKWEISPLEVSHVESSFFENSDVFPEGSVKFDNALLMKDIEHDWLNVRSKVCD